MARYIYEDFEVTMSARDDGDFDVLASCPDGSRLTATFRIPLDAAELERTIVTVARSRGRSRATREVLEATETSSTGAASVAQVDPVEEVERLGAALADGLFHGIVGEAYEKARASSLQAHHGLRLTLTLGESPQLLNLPWEFMYRRPRFLASQRHTPLVRRLEVANDDSPRTVEDHVRILGVVSNPSDLAQLDTAAERKRVEDAVAAMTNDGRARLDWLEPATPRRLREALRDTNYDILHYVGHSAFTADEEGALYLEDDAGAAHEVDATTLANLLGDQTTLRLVVLNSCEGARTTLTDPYAGIATTLIQLGVPAVVAMQFEISDRAAILFAEELYTNLIGRRDPIDAAVSEARKAIYVEVDRVEWATPVLFVREPGVQLFDFETARNQLPPPMAGTANRHRRQRAEHAHTSPYPTPWRPGGVPQTRPWPATDQPTVDMPPYLGRQDRDQATAPTPVGSPDHLYIATGDDDLHTGPTSTLGALGSHAASAPVTGQVATPVAGPVDPSAQPSGSMVRRALRRLRPLVLPLTITLIVLMALVIAALVLVIKFGTGTTATPLPDTLGPVTSIADRVDAAPPGRQRSGRLAFAIAEPTGRTHIYSLVNETGQFAQETSEDEATDTQPNWDRTGNRIVFRRAVNDDGSIISYMASGTGDGDSGLKVDDLTSPIVGRFDLLPAWTGSGELVYLSSNGCRPGPECAMELHKLTLQASADELGFGDVLTPVDDEVVATGFVDATAIAADPNGSGAVVVADANGVTFVDRLGRVARLTDVAGVDAMAFTADGSTLVYAEPATGGASTEPTLTVIDSSDVRTGLVASDIGAGFRILSLAPGGAGTSLVALVASATDARDAVALELTPDGLVRATDAAELDTASQIGVVQTITF